jgi:hypothetical protein
MEKDKEITDVVFRYDTTKDWKGTIYALLPHECCDNKGNVTTYQHVGQHSAADYLHCIGTSRPATPEEYADLKKEMESMRYNFNVMQKRNYEKFLISYRQRN